MVVFFSLLTLSACAAAETEGDATKEIAVVDNRFDGDFTVTDLNLGGAEVELALAPTITIESVFGALTIKPGCNTYFGSLSLTETGEASFTVTGGSNESCPNLADQESMLLEALDQVDRWEEKGDGFRLFAGSGVELTLTR